MVCRNFFVFCFEPNSGIRANLCIVFLVRIERIEDAGVDFLIVTLLFASVHICGIVGLQAASRPTLRVGKTGSTIDVRLVSYLWLRRDVSFFSLVDMIFAMEGPLAVVKETISESPLRLHARR
jgi:hypothetical protein